MLDSSDEQLFKDWLETDTIVNSELSPVISLGDLPDVIPEHDEYRTMPHSLRHVLTPPTPEPSGRRRSILVEHPQSSHSSSPYSRPRWSPVSDGTGVSRARQSVSSIGSCSTVHTRSALPIRSILTRHDSGISMATTTASTRRKKKRSPSSVKFVDVPTVHYDVVYHNTLPRSPPSPPSEREKKSTRWFAKWWKRSSTPPPRPVISGPYHISYSASLVDVHASRAPEPEPSRLKQLWNRLTSLIG